MRGEAATLTKRTRRMRVACRRRVANSHLTLPSSREWSRKNATLYRFSLSIFCVFLFGRVEGNFLFGQSNVNGNMNAANVNVSECVCANVCKMKQIHSCIIFMARWGTHTHRHIPSVCLCVCVCTFGMPKRFMNTFLLLLLRCT